MSNPNSTPNAFRDPISYMSLFDDTEFNNIGEAYSLYGPGAYFVKLMNLALSDKVVPEQDDDPRAPLSLAGRRPDLKTLQLTRDNTNRTFPLLRAVINNTLNSVYLRDENPLIPLWDPVPFDNHNWSAISTSDAFVPYDKCVSSIDRFTRAFGVPLFELVEQLTYMQQKDEHWPFAVLNLSPFTLSIFFATPANYWPQDVTPTPELLMMATGLNEETLTELVYNGIHPNDITALGSLYINADQPDKPLQYLPATQKGAPATFQNFTLSRQKQLRTLLILSERTGWGVHVTNAVLNTLGIKGLTDKNTSDAMFMLAQLHVVANTFNINLQQFAKGGSGMDARVFLATTPVNSIPGNAQVNGKDAKQLAALLSFASLVPDDGPDNHPALINYAATGLGISAALLSGYLKVTGSQPLTLDTLMHLCNLKKQLDVTGSSLSDYILVLIENANPELKFTDFDRWFTQLQDMLEHTISNYSAAGNQLDELVFKQWIHELSVYWGLHENEVFRLFHGYFSANGTPEYDNANDVFLRKDQGQNAKTFLLAWLPYLVLVTRLQFSPEVVEMGSAKLYFSYGSIMPKGLDDEKLFALLRLQQLFAQTLAENRPAFLTMVTDKDFGYKAIVDGMPKISSWTAADIRLLADSLGVNDSSAPWQSLVFLGRLGNIFALSARTTLDIPLMLNCNETLNGSDIAPAVAQQLQDLLEKAAATDPAMHARYQQSTQKMLEADRDAIIPMLLWWVNRHFNDIVTWDQLSDYCLMDISVSGVMEVTPVREATDAVQSYLLRCRNGLEKIKKDPLKEIDKATWDWVFSFRLWEAEQKLQQYPQNYFQIDNRDDATDLFNEFKSQLQQQDINADVTRDAMQFYIDGWLKLTDKVIVDASYHTRASDGKNIVCFLARSNSAMQQYFYLEAERTANGLEHYTQWHEVETRIPADTATIVYAFNRYFIFWSELSSKTDSDPTSTSNKKYTIHSAAVKYTTQDVRGNWLAASDWDSFPFYLTTEDKDSDILRWKSAKDVISISRLFMPYEPWWKKPMTAVIDGSLYVWLSPSVADTSGYDLSLMGSKTVDTAFNQFMNTIVAHATGKSPLLLYPKKLDVTGLITTYDAQLLYPQVIQQPFPVGWNNALNKRGVAALNEFSFSDIYDGTIGHLKSAGTFTQKVKENLINLMDTQAVNADQKQLTWNVLDVKLIRNMQAAIFVTDKGTLLLMPEQVTQPFAYTMSYSQNIIVMNAAAVAGYKMITLKSLYPQFFNSIFRQKGLDYSLSFVLQSQPIEFDTSYSYASYQTSGNVKMPDVVNSTQAQFTGAYGIYCWEIFFYAPALIARYLRTNLYNEEAGHWYRYILNPFAANTIDAWNFLPFHDPPKTLTTVWSYKKWLTEQYIDNIHEWGDNEFRQETWESLNIATQLYFEAEDLLGETPDIIDRTTAFTSKSRTYEDIIKGKPEDFFGWPTDEVLKAHWTIVSDRLYKIRHGLNIDGQPQMPSEYGSPIDPGRLKLALATGGINPFDDSGLSIKNTIYRFRDLLPAAEAVIEMTIQFGIQLESALQQHDGEKLQLLQATHQLNMQNFIVQNYQAQIDEAQAEVNAITESLSEAQNQVNHYKGLVQAGLLAPESDGLSKSNSAVALQLSAAVVKEPAAIAHLIPTVFGFSDGCFQPGSAIDSAAGIISETASAAQTSAQIQETQAGYARRAQEWAFAAASAEMQVAQLGHSLTAANKRLLMTQTNLQQYQLSVSQSQDILNFLSNKFTNADLYNWLTGQLSSLYFKAYQLGLAALHRLQTAYAYELDDNSTFIPSGSWNSLRKGLLAGETLKLALARMKDAYLTKNVRRQELERIISLKQLTAGNWQQFLQSGSLNFSIVVADLTVINDPRMLKVHSAAVSIPAVIGPYDVFNGMLKNNGTGEQISISRGIDDMGIFPDDINDGRYLPFEGMKVPKSAEGDDGANANWSLSIPDPKIFANISDVILTIRFTAK